MNRPGPAAELGPDTVLAQLDACQLEWVEVEDQVIVWNGAEGELHHLDRIATLVFRLCDGTTTLGDTVADLALVFGCEPEQIWSDVSRCVEQLCRDGLIEPVAGL